MKTIKINLYKFSELSEEAKQKALNKLSDINVEFDWWSSTYEDSKNIGLKITGFNLDNSRHADGKFINSAPETAEKIISEHGEECETYKTAKTFLNDLQELNKEHENIEDVDEGKIEDLEDDFLKSLLEDYSIILQKESEYLQSEKAIIETIEANDYDFTEDGKQY